MNASRVVKCLLFLAVFVGSLQADLIVYDGFDYPVGSLEGNEGGVGWDPGVAWSGGQNVASPGLEYPSLKTVGNTASAADSASFRMMPTGFNALNNTTWISFLCLDLETPEWCGISTYNDGDESLFIGKPGNARNVWGIHLYNVLGDAGAKTGSEDSQTSISELVFFVVRIVNGSSDARITAWINPDLNREPSNDTAFYDSEAAGHKAARVPFNRIRIDGPGEAMFFDELRIGETYADVAGTSDQEKASLLQPGDGAPDVSATPVLAWSPGIYAGEHDVYLGVSWDDVNDATVDDSSYRGRQQATTYTPDQLTLGETYCWRIDEVNATPDQTVYKGNVWIFTVEPVAYPVTNIVATTNGVSDTTGGPENTVNGSGLNANDDHSTEATDMWLASPSGADPVYIQYEFDGIYQLHEMLVWNYNVMFEPILGFGLKDVTVEYSLDGTEWTLLDDVVFARGTAAPDYAANTTVAFNGVATRFVRLTVIGGYGAMPQYGLSEVRFMFIPAYAREPLPSDGAVGTSVDALLIWRSGRDAIAHDVSFGADPDALAVVETVATPSFTPGALDLDTTYYWKVDSVQEAVTWEGAIWSFRTQAYLVVEDFESYDDDENRIYETWIDGYGAADNGSQVGHLESPFAETMIVNSGRQAMPLFYDNTETSISEAELALAQDWAAHGITSLSLYFHGAANNGGQLYVKINGAKVVYDGAETDIATPTWQLWNIDLSAVGGNMGSVTSLAIGIEGAGTSGVIYIDDVRLYAR